MPYSLVALDLDGTTIGRDLAIPPAVRAAIGAARAQGVVVTFATGRMYNSTRAFAGQLGLDAPLICYQGALIRRPTDDATLAHFTMPADLAAVAVQSLLDAEVCTIAYVDEKLCAAERRPELEEYLSYHPNEADVRIDPALAALVAHNPPTKILFVAEPATIEHELGRLAQQFDGRLAAMRSHTNFGELTAPGVSKGAALARLAAELGIAREQVVAIGDQENDLSMIEWAGLGLAMGNAVPAVRAAAAAVVPPVEQAGVAWALQQYVLR
jgi:hypothetical protein